MVPKLKTIPFLERENSQKYKYVITNYFTLINIARKGAKHEK